MVLGISKKWIAYFLAVYLIVVLSALLELPGSRFEAHFLNVGQGDSIFIQTPDNAQILIDGGRGSDVLLELNEVMSFFDDSIDMLVATHPDSDHIGGLIPVLERYKVDYVLLTGIYEKEDDYFEFLKAVKDNGSNIILADADADFRFGEVYFDILYPFENLTLESFDDPNNTSIVIKVSYKDTKILLTGDMEAPIEEALIKKRIDLRANILKVGHHGSKSSSTWEFLQKVGADVAVIQVGKNSYGHPVAEILERLEDSGVSKIWRNDLDGRVDLIF